MREKSRLGYPFSAKWSFSLPCCLLSCEPQPATALLGDCGKFFDGLPLGLPSDANFLQQPCCGTGNRASAAHLHWMHLHPSPLFLCFSCQVGIAQLFPFVCLIDCIFPRDCQLNDKERTKSWHSFVKAISEGKVSLLFR